MVGATCKIDDFRLSLDAYQSLVDFFSKRKEGEIFMAKQFDTKRIFIAAACGSCVGLVAQVVQGRPLGVESCLRQAAAGACIGIGIFGVGPINTKNLHKNQIGQEAPAQTQTRNHELQRQNQIGQEAPAQTQPRNHELQRPSEGQGIAFVSVETKGREVGRSPRTQRSSALGLSKLLERARSARSS
jgi:hypothetical protein